MTLSNVLLGFLLEILASLSFPIIESVKQRNGRGETGEADALAEPGGGGAFRATASREKWPPVWPPPKQNVSLC